MILYDEDYLVKLLCRLDGSTGPRAVLFAMPSGLLAVLLLVCNDQIKNFFQESGIDAITGSQSWAAVTGVLVLLLGFRTRQALSRFWEGTGLLHQMRGEWFDSVSCCVTFSRPALAAKKAEVMEFRHTLVRLMSLCHGSALEEIADDNGNIPTIDLTGLDVITLRHLKECKEQHDFNRVEVILHLIQTLITKNLDIGVLKIPPPILSRVYQTLSRGFVNLLNAKKITDTRFPFPYAQLIALLLILHTVLTPVMIAELISHKAWAFIFTFVPIFGMFSLNFTASQLENPFGNDDNDLPLEHFQDEMNSSLLMLLHNNSDHIAGISHMAVLEFKELADSMKDEHEGAVPRVGLLPSVSSVAESPRQTPRSQTPRSSPRAAIVAALKSVGIETNDKHGQAPPPGNEKQAEATPPPPPPPERKVETSESPAPRPATAPAPAPEAAPAAPAAPAPAPAPPAPAAAAPAPAPAPVQAAAPAATPGTPQVRLLTGMDDFNSALQAWTKTVDSQIGELSRSFADLRKISDSMPGLLESVQAAQRSKGKAIADEDAISSLKAFPAV